MKEETENCPTCGGSSCTDNNETGDTLTLGNIAPSCTLDIKSREEGEKWYREEFINHAKEIREIESGYDVIFEKPGPELFKNILFAFGEDTKCCGAFHLSLTVEPNHSVIHYQYYGSDQAKVEMMQTWQYLGVTDKIESNLI